MAKLYVFGIGGTGSRVLRALTMLLASGVRCDMDTIVPIVIDPDGGGGNVDDAAVLMRHYGEVRANLSFADDAKNRFFRTEITNIVSSPNFQMKLSHTDNNQFSEYINLAGMSDANKALAKALFSNKNLSSNMVDGFKGNPNIGSVVLNQFEGSDDFDRFANDFGANDRIFIISSIFGGTGASGFPLLVKTLRTSPIIPNHNLLQNAPIGAITVLPYFKVTPKPESESQVDSSTFPSKTRSALKYYYRTFEAQGGMMKPDVHYYIGDDMRCTVYENVQGGAGQYNNAHFIEFASALAIIDFANINRVGGAPCIYKEFGIENDANDIIYNNLASTTLSLIRKPLTQFTLFAKFLRDCKNYLGNPWARDHGIDTAFMQGQFFQKLYDGITMKYLKWLDEMHNQNRAFSPYDTEYNVEKVFNLVEGLDPQRVWKLDRNYDLFNKWLDEKNVSGGNKEQQFMELFYLATETICKEKLNIG